MLASTGLLSFSRTLVGYPPPMEEEHPRSLGCRVRSIQLAHVIILFPRRSRTPPPRPIQSKRPIDWLSYTHTKPTEATHRSSDHSEHLQKKENVPKSWWLCCVIAHSVRAGSGWSQANNPTLAGSRVHRIYWQYIAVWSSTPPALRLYFNSADVHRQGTTSPRKGAHRQSQVGVISSRFSCAAL